MYIIVLFIIILILNLNIYKNNIIYMNLLEILEFNIKLFFINRAGLTDIDKKWSNYLEIFINDSILVLFHRKLQKKYKNIISTNIITYNHQYYILESLLATQILKDSPLKFSAGKIKENYFLQIMPKNIGIAKCSKHKCPWIKKRKFNIYVLGTDINNIFFNCITEIINIITKKPLIIDDFIDISYKIVSYSIFGELNNKNINIIRNFIEYSKESNFLNTDFYNLYKNHIEKYYENPKKCSLLYLCKSYKTFEFNDIIDEIPHWFAPLIFIIKYLIPNLLCILFNFKEHYNIILEEINNSNFDIYSKNTYLHYCVIEHIRLFNTININMQKTVNYNMNYYGYNLKKGDQIFILFSSILRNPNKFINPDSFNPKRWKDKNIDEQNIVFGIGPQICPSKNITPLYYKYIMYNLLTKFTYNNVNIKLKNDNLFFINPYKFIFE